MSAPVTFLFTDVEGSTRLWETEPERMRPALARHDAELRAAIEANGGEVVKRTGDGVHAAFEDPLGAVLAAVRLQMAMMEAEAAFGVPLRVRCGLHRGESERRDDDYYGAEVNRAARIMSAAHGGQMLLSRAVADRVDGRLPDGVSLRDLGEVRLRDLARPERLYQVLHPRLRPDFPALRSLAETPNNLPSALTSFIGRERELESLAQALAASRLVTVVGMGGVGKTRLALHAAAEALDGFPDGAWLVELAASHDPRLVAQALATALGLQEEPGLGVEESLLRHLKDRAALLVLDNCEHLREACARLAYRILGACPGVKLLATSREALGIAGESCLPLSGLAVPGPREAVDAAAALPFASVQLFVERARAVNPALRPEDYGAAIAAICHRLDGIPLAIELAAARTRSLSIPQIALRLNDRFKLLAGQDPTVPPKQRTLRALIDWSYDLLPEGERRVFESLSAFAGGWTLEAAEAVCAEGAGEQAAVLDALGRLVDKSLIALDSPAERYHMLETVRQYAQAKLAQREHGAAIGRRHFAYYRGLAKAARAALVGPAQSRWLSVLDAERDNLLAAHAAVDVGAADAEAGLELASLLKLYWINRGLLELGERVTREALAREGAQAHGDARCRALFDAGQLRYFMGDYTAAKALLEESLAIARELRDENKVAAVLQPLGMTALGLGDRVAARCWLTEALALADRQGHRRGIATAANVLGQLCRVEGRAGEASAWFERSVEISRADGDREMVAVGLLNAAMAMIEAGEEARAPLPVLEALEIAQAQGSSPTLKSVLEVCCGLAGAAGHHAAAARFFGAAEARAEKTALGRDPADAAFLDLCTRRAREAIGADAFEAAARAGRALGPPEAAIEARQLLEALREDRPPSPCR